MNGLIYVVCYVFTENVFYTQHANIASSKHYLIRHFFLFLFRQQKHDKIINHNVTSIKTKC